MPIEEQYSYSILLMTSNINHQLKVNYLKLNYLKTYKKVNNKKFKNYLKT